MNSKYEQVKKDFFSGRIKGCKDFFIKHNYPLEAGYCYIVLENLAKAEEMFKISANDNIRGHWGVCLVQMIRNELYVEPTYFEIRNFLEIDLSILITYYKGKYIENIMRYANFMSSYNPECYKFIGRAFWAHKLMPAAMFYLNKAKEVLYNDPELHYLLGYIYYNAEQIEASKKEIQVCLDILPQYAPAKALITKINTKLEY